MARFTVTSGPLRVTMVADDAYEAAAEAVSQWAARRCEEVSPARERGLRHLGPRHAGLGVEVRVASDEPGARIERFATFSLLAHVNREPVEAAWKRLLSELVSRN